MVPDRLRAPPKEKKKKDSSTPQFFYLASACVHQPHVFNVVFVLAWHCGPVCDGDGRERKKHTRPVGDHNILPAAASQIEIINEAAGCDFIVSYPDPDSQQLRMDYITATWKVAVMLSIRSCWESGSGYETSDFIHIVSIYVL